MYVIDIRIQPVAMLNALAGFDIGQISLRSVLNMSCSQLLMLLIVASTAYGSSKTTY